MSTRLILETSCLPEGGLHVVFGDEGRPFTLSRLALAELERALDRWESREELRWVAFTSASPTTFLAGANFRELRQLGAEGASGFSRMGQRLFRRMRASRLWLVACVRGACMGGGVDFALACDYRVADPAARFAHPGPSLGLMTGWGGTAFLPRRGTPGSEALLRARRLTASEALREGWIEEVAPRPLARATLRARQSKGIDLPRLKRLCRAADLPLLPALRYERWMAVDPVAHPC